MQTDLYINQGIDWIEAVDYINDDFTPLNLTGYSFLCSFRTSYSTANISGNLTVSIINAAAGNTRLSMDSADTSNVNAGKYVYDVVMIDNFGNKARTLEGFITFRPGVTIR